MPNNCCSVPGCSNRGGHVFPSDKSKRKAWIIAIRREGEGHQQWRPTAYSVVCKKHFLASDYKETSVVGTALARQTLKPSSVPSVFQWSVVQTSTAEERRDRVHRRGMKRQLELDCKASELEEITNCSIPIAQLDMEAVIEISSSTDIQGTADKQLQTDAISVCHADTQTDKSTVSDLGRMSIDNFTTNPEGIKFYTGLDSYSTFCDVLSSLDQAAYKLNYVYSRPSIQVQDQLFLTIIKCRLYKTNFELSQMFRITESEVYSIIVTWLRFMSLQWREINIWPEREVVDIFAPSDFAAKYPSTRVIFDGTEIPIKKPKNPAAQQVTFSTYKNKNTAKVVVGVTPGGLSSYVSNVYGGCTSDRQIIERSDVMSKVEKNDVIMADKGFDVQDIFAAKDVMVNIPTFFKKKNRMTGQCVMRDRKIASKRVHVERVIGLGKTYKILCHPLNHTEILLAKDIVFVCFMLVNFRNCIVPKTA